MANSQDFIDHVIDMAAAFRPVTARRMFGGHGLYVDGVMLGLVAGDTLYLKADDGNRPEFEAAGSGPFVYQAKGRKTATSYYQAPAETMEDGQVLSAWFAGAFAAALRARAATPAGRRQPGGQP